tara:strand:- start:6819 stop:10097 length:3279 start_codon:yes stop_codon:yes gene_type:complete
MANYSDLLMSIVFFGDAYVKARKRNEAEKADRAYRQLQEKIQQAQLEAANAKTKAIEREENRLAKERERKSATEQIALRGGDVTDVSRARDAIRTDKEYFISPEGTVAETPFLKPGGLGPARGGVRTAPLLQEAQPGKAPLDITDLSLRGKPTLPSAMERLQAGKSIIPTTAERAFPGGTYQPPAMTSAMRGEYPALADRPALAERLTEPRMERPQLAETVREDLAAPGISRQQQFQGGTKEEDLGLIDLDEMTAATMLKEVAELKFPLKGDIDYEIMQETAEKINDDRIIRTRDKQLQAKVNAVPEGIKSSAKQLLLLNVGTTAATPRNILTISDMLRKAGYTKDDEVKNAQVYSTVQRQIQEARTPPKIVTDADRAKNELAKLKAETEKRDLKRQEAARIKLNAFPQQVQDVAKLAISVSEGIGTLKEDLGTQAIIAKMMMDQGWDPTQSPTSPDNDKIFKNISLAFQKAEIDDTVPDIKIDDDRHHLLAFVAADKFAPASKRQKMQLLKTARDLDVKYKDKKYTTFQDTLHSMVYDDLSQGAKNDMLFQDNLMDQLGSVGEVYKEFLRLGGTTSLLKTFSGEWIKQRRLPKDWVGLDPRLDDIMNKINILYWDFRNNLTGAHFSETEAQNYLSIFPNLRDTPERFFLGMDSVLNAYADKKHNVYRSVLGPKNYDSVFDAPEGKTGLSPQENIYSLGTKEGTVRFSLDNLPQSMRTKDRDEIKEIMGPDGTGDWEPKLPATDVNKIYLYDPENTSQRMKFTTIEDGSFIWSGEGNLYMEEFAGILDTGVDTELESLNKKLLEVGKRPYSRDEIQRIRRDIEDEKQQQLRTQTDREYMAREGISALSPERQISPVITPPMPTTFIGKSIPNLQKLGSPGLGEEQSISETELGRLNQQMMKRMGNGLEIKYQDNINFPGETKEYKAVGISRQQAKDGIPRWGFVVIDPDTRQQKFLYFQDKGIVGLNKKKADRLNELLRGEWNYTGRETPLEVQPVETIPTVPATRRQPLSETELRSELQTAETELKRLKSQLTSVDKSAFNYLIDTGEGTELMLNLEKTQPLETRIRQIKAELQTLRDRQVRGELHRSLAQ